jgi:flagellar motor switch protein FliN
VTQTTSMPYDWLKQIPTALLQLDEIPLIGFAPPFPWDELAKAIGETFEIHDFKIQAGPLEWCEEENLYKTLGDNLTTTTITIPSLEGELSWVMAAEDVHRLMSLLLNEQHHEHDVLEDEFLSGFYYFTAYEVIHALTKLPFGKSLSPQVQKESHLIKEASLCSDIHITLRGQTLTGRAIISPALRRSWKEKYAERSLELPVNSALAEKLMISVHLEVGKTSIKPKEWNAVKTGDFVLLDSCTIQPEDEKGGRVTLTVNGMPFYIGKLKDGNIKILDHPLYNQEESTDMPNQTPADHDHDEDSSFDFDTEDSELHTDLDSEIETDLDSEVESEAEAEDSEVESAAENDSIAEASASEEAAAEEEEPTEETIPAEPTFKIDEIPLSVIIEVGRLQMSVKKMMDLQPGNLLELDVHPENGVDLVVNGKRIAKGELVKLGEALGVRILDIS